MRHVKRLKKLGLPKHHRDSLLKNLIASLVIHGRITTTENRAKALASRFGRMMTLVSRKEAREAVRTLANYCTVRAAAIKIIQELKPKYKDRNSGYTRITRMNLRAGDRARRVSIELI